MKTVAIIGTGIMGSGMAHNFLKHGYSVVVWNKTLDKLAPLLERGAERAATPAEAVAKADIVFEVTANDESSREMWLGEEGILKGARKDTVLVASGTFSIDWIDELARVCTESGLTFLDIPLTGSRMGAESGTMTMLAGGDEAVLERIRPDLAAISGKVLYFGPVGSGMRYKLLLNTLQAIHVSAFGEVMRLAERAGLDMKRVGDALSEHPGGTGTKLMWHNMQHPPEQTNFSVQWIHKDLEYAKELGGNFETPFLDDAIQTFEQALEEGKGEKDWSVVVTGGVSK